MSEVSGVQINCRDPAGGIQGLGCGLIDSSVLSVARKCGNAHGLARSMNRVAALCSNQNNQRQDADNGNKGGFPKEYLHIELRPDHGAREPQSSIIQRSYNWSSAQGQPELTADCADFTDGDWILFAYFLSARSAATAEAVQKANADYPRLKIWKRVRKDLQSNPPQAGCRT